MPIILDAKTPARSLNKAFLKETTARTDIERFKAQLQLLIEKADPVSSEDTLKDYITDFLKNTWYNPDRAITINKERKDFSIHSGKTAKDPVAVIAEVKKNNSAEMMSAEKTNVKALHELILYYLQERISLGNNQVKFLLATDVQHWILIDANEFDKKIYANTRIKKLYEVFVNDKKDNPFFYEEIKKILSETELTIVATIFDLNSFKKYVTNADKADDEKLTPLYKILSPVHLLKLPFANDSNSLDKNFYAELLHLIGLEEISEGSKKLIQRKKESSEASLIENAIIKIRDKDCIRDLPDATRYGLTQAEQEYNIALELCITWINRILFLKLLEGQLLAYHKSEKVYLFLNENLLPDFDELNNLFFQVLAEKPENRRSHLQNKFSKVPYLNSSLFERTELERRTIDISALDNALHLPLHKFTVLKDEKTKRRQGALPTLPYLFSFLDSYDFTSEGKAGIQEENKTLINASVLGLIFEKINGYKDGSFFTPGFITMYMCRETLRRAVTQKFNERYGWNCSSFEDLPEKIEFQDKEKRQEANTLINSLTICDPAVGSGHFLVSALNELICIKHDLKILQYRHNGQRIREYSLEIVNDELIIQDIETEELFTYTLNQKGNSKTELQQLQETLFHEKETLIENCLFGVDINPNSVKICRLRLWIELLKNAYYTSESQFTQLETLPNIDINIKQGNSLISRFALDADLAPALKKSKFSIEAYKAAVQTYRNADNKEEKREMETLIETIKNDFQKDLSPNDPINKELSKLRGKLAAFQQTDLFSTDTKKKTKANKELEKLAAVIEKLEKERADIKSNAIYKDAFEWRFMFPEVLDNEGKFVGFDVVIGNPPYLKVQSLNHSEIDWYKSNKEIAYKRVDISILFFELGFQILNKQKHLSFITSNQFLTTEYGRLARKFLLEKFKILKIIDFGDLPVFPDALTYVSIFINQKQKPQNFLYKKVLNLESDSKYQYEPFINIDILSLSEETWILSDSITKKVIHKLELFPRLQDIAKCSYGIISGADDIFIISKEDLSNYHIEKEIILPLIRAENCYRYGYAKTDQFIIYPYKSEHNQTKLISSAEFENKFPNAFAHLLKNKQKLELRKDSRGTFENSDNWYSLTRFGQIETFKQPLKIVFPGEQKRPKFGLDLERAGYSGARVFGITPIEGKKSINYILGVLNSKIFEFYIKSTFPLKQGGYFSMSTNSINNFPIPPEPPTITKVEALIDKILAAKKADPSVDTTEWEAEIDEMVFELYGLTEEEKELVRGI